MPDRRIPVLLAGLLLVSPLPAADAQQETPSEFERRLGGRMLGGVRAWLDSLYYDSTYGGRNLDELETRAQMAIDTASTRAVVFGAIAQFLQELGDSHTRFYPPGLNVEVDYGWSWRMIGDDCFVTAVTRKSDAEAQGLVVGDKVLAIDGIQPTRANGGVIWYVYHLLSPRLGMRLQVERRDGTRTSVTFKAKTSRRPDWVDLDNIDHWRMLRDESELSSRVDYWWRTRDTVALLRFTSFGYRDNRLDRYMQDARRYPWLILDFRGNPGGAVEGVTRLLGHFFDETVPGFVQRWRDSTVTFMIEPRGRGGRYAGQVVILLDSESASGAELTARILQQHDRAMVVGDRSSGQLTAARSMSLSESASGRMYLYGMSVAVYDIVMPDGQRVEKQGVIPNIAALPTSRDLAEGAGPGTAVRSGDGGPKAVRGGRGEHLEIAVASTPVPLRRPTLRYKVHGTGRAVEAPVTALTRFFFHAVYAPMSAWSVIGWWESRRTAFNLAVGGAGIVTLVTINLLSLLPPGGSGFGVPLLPVVAYGLLANVGYTAGPLADLLIRRLWGHGYAAVGPTLFRYGFVFSVGLTLLPIPLFLLHWVMRLIG